MDCRPTLHSPRPSLSPDGLFLFILASTFGFLEPWYTFRDLCGPPLISSALRIFGTLPERYLRYLGKLLNQLPIFRRDCSSLPGI